MKKVFERLNKPIVRGSIILLVTFGIFNILNYIFHFTMLHLLTVAEYGVVATLFSFIYIFGIFTESIQTVVTKYTSNEKNEGKLKNIIKRASRRAFFVSFLFFSAYLLISLVLSPLLKIPYGLLAVTGIIIFTSFLLPITRGVMQGRQRFTALGRSMVLESVVKLALGILLVYGGWKVYGAMIASVLGVVLALVFSFFDREIRTIFASKEKTAPTPQIWKYSLPVFILTFTVLAFYSIDVFIAKVVFDADTAGYYALAAIIAKTIFFLTYPIGKAMFPLSAEGSGKKNPGTFKHAIILLLLCIVAALLFIYFFPELLIWISSGKSAPLSISILFILSIGTSALALSNMTILYKLSQGNVRGYGFALAFLALEILLLLLFSANIQQFALAFLTANVCFLWWVTTFLEGEKK
ncbi:MAG: oligosaccharide flippase family protein [Nanoarchaeota archaeon]